MEINNLFGDINEINITSYLEKCGIKDIEEYLNGEFVESYDNYDNIKECVEEIIKWVN